MFLMTYDPSADGLIERLKAEFLEMPGLKLTAAQAQRLWALDAISCSALLETLVNTNFLFRTRDGAFMRIERAAPARAPLPTRSKPASVA
jgi:hypothetical protein